MLQELAEVACMMCKTSCMRNGTPFRLCIQSVSQQRFRQSFVDEERKDETMPLDVIQDKRMVNPGFPLA